MTRTAKRQGTKSKNYKNNENNIWYKRKIKVGGINQSRQRCAQIIEQIATERQLFGFENTSSNES